MIVGDPYTYTTIAANTADEAGIVPTTGLRLMGFTARETAGSAATLNLCHGTDGLVPVALVNLAASKSDSQSFLPQGLDASGGIWIERLTGTSAITLITSIQ